MQTEPSVNGLAFTPAETAYLLSFLNRGDRGGYYVALYNMTGSTQALEQAQISTFSEGLGGTAYLSNFVLQTITAPNDYPGLYYLSQQVAKKSFEAIQKSMAGGGTGYLDVNEFFLSANNGWKGEGLEHLFPGNLLDGTLGNLLSWVTDHYTLPPLEDTESIAQVLGDLASEGKLTVPDFISRLFTKGAFAGFVGAIGGAAYLGKRLSDYESHPDIYEIKTLPDSTYKIAISKETGKVTGIFNNELLPSSMPEVLNRVSAVASKILAGPISAAVTSFLSTFIADFHRSLSENTPGFNGDINPRVTNTYGGGVLYPVSDDPTADNDTRWGTGGLLSFLYADTLHGRAGDDRIFGGDGGDTLVGDEGDDIVYGQSGSDTLYGGAGTDVLRGGRGADVLYGGEGNDTLDGEDVVPGNDEAVDILFGEAGQDVLAGGGGADFLSGGSDADSLYGGAGSDILDGGSGSDILVGGAGQDWLGFTSKLESEVSYDDLTSVGNYYEGGTENDFLSGSQGDDIYAFRVGDGQDTLWSHGGSDQLQLQIRVSEEGALREVPESAVKFLRDGLDLKVCLIESNGSVSDYVRVVGWFDKSSGENALASVSLGAKVWTRSEIEALALHVVGSANADVLRGIGGFQSILEGNGGSDSYYTGDVGDYVVLGSGDNKVFGGGGHDVLEVTSFLGETSLFLGSGSAEVITPGVEEGEPAWLEFNGRNILLHVGWDGLSPITFVNPGSSAREDATSILKIGGVLNASITHYANGDFAYRETYEDGYWADTRLTLDGETVISWQGNTGEFGWSRYLPDGSYFSESSYADGSKSSSSQDTSGTSINRFDGADGTWSISTSFGIGGGYSDYLRAGGGIRTFGMELFRTIQHSRGLQRGGHHGLLDRWLGKLAHKIRELGRGDG